MTAYYNEHDAYAAQWLRNLIQAGHIAPGIVDERSIEDVYPSDLRGFTQCHFFAGIGVWSHALRLAGWGDDRPVWTGSCPCQPFSAAGDGVGFDDERHLWPAWHHLIKECAPVVVFGEQVASPDGLGWLDLVQADLEAANYACGAVDLCAAGVGAPHIRQRLWFVANANGRKPGYRSVQRCRQHGQQSQDRGFAGWRDVRRIRCSDGMVRSIEPGSQPLAHGIAGRLGRIRAYGNAINAQAARVFIEAAMQQDDHDCDLARGGVLCRECDLRTIERYSKVLDSDSKNTNGLVGVNLLTRMEPSNLAEWTGLEPATPGVTGRCAK
jgi:DNA (cytosine-5)-methyltransferase 1